MGSGKLKFYRCSFSRHAFHLKSPADLFHPFLHIHQPVAGEIRFIGIKAFAVVVD